MPSGLRSSARSVADHLRSERTTTALMPFPIEDHVSPTHVVAWRGQGAVYAPDFRARVSAWIATLRPISEHGLALFEPDGVEFAAALLAAWHLHRTVYLPGDAQQATCRALAALGVGFAGAFAAEFHPVVAAPDAEGFADAASISLAGIDADAIDVVIYTSGSTGAPQALRKRLAQLLAEVTTLEHQFGAQVNGCDVFATVSHQHIYGLLFKILWPLAAGRAFRAETVLYPETMHTLLHERRAAIISGPAHLKRLPTTLAWSDVRAQVGAVFSSGGPLPLASVELTESTLGVAPYEVYGSSETGGIAWRQRTGARDLAWTPLSGIAVRAEDECLAVRSRHLPDREWHVIADRVAFVNAEQFTLLGRADRIAKIEGKRVSLAAIEDAITHTGLAAEARVLVLDGTQPSERDAVGAVVAPSDEGWALMRRESPAALRHALEAAARDVTEPLARPRKWRFVDALPLNAVGKPSHDLLSQLFAPFSLRMPAVHILHRDESRVHLELYVSPHLRCFDGHFASVAVLPGIAQVDWSVAYGRALLGVRGTFERLEAIKFHRLYRPGALLTAEVQWHAERHMLSFRYTSSGGTHSSGRIFFAH